MKTIEDPPLSTSDLDGSEIMMRFRELKGLDKAMQTQQEELVNNLARLSDIDRHLNLENGKLRETDEPKMKWRISEKIRNLMDERAAWLEAASANREALRSQISQVREIRRILQEDNTLAERIKTLFREQGITVISILTAIGMTLNTSTNRWRRPLSPHPTTTVQPGKVGIRQWVKTVAIPRRSTLKTSREYPCMGAIPGVIGSVVSWLLSTAGKVVGSRWLAEHTWALLIAIGGLLLVAAKEWLAKHKPQDN